MNATTLAATTAAALLLAGCSTVLDGFGSASNSSPSPMENAQITPAPTGSVESSAVPAAQPAYGAAAATAGAAVTPKPSTANNSVALTAPPAATAPGGVAYAEPGAARSQLAGKWTFTWDGGQKSCPVTLSTSQGMSGLAASRRPLLPERHLHDQGLGHVGQRDGAAEPSRQGHRPPAAGRRRTL